MNATKERVLKKVSMNLSERSLENIEKLSSLISEKNKTRVVASALEIAKYIIEAEKKGGKVTIKSPDGSSQVLKIII